MDDEAHRMLTRRFKGHATSVWCTCGWAAPHPVKLTSRPKMVEFWRKHLEAACGAQAKREATDA